MNMNDEYYLVVDDDLKEVQVCNYVFDDDHPSGYERKVFKRSFSKGSPFNFEDAKSFCSRLCDIFNSKRFRRETVGYV